MRSEKSGKPITKIVITKEKVSVYFNKERLSLSYDTFTSHYLYEGKLLSDKEINELKKDNDVSEGYEYAKKLLLKATYTEWKMREKLYAKEYDKPIVDAVIDKLKKAKLINDKAFIKDYIRYGNDKLMGQNKIIQNLKSLGVFDENLKDVSFSEAKELSKAKKLLPKFERRYQSLSTVQKRQHIMNAYINEGYQLDIAMKLMNQIKITSERKEKENLHKAYKQVKLVANRKKLKGEERREFIINKLMAKGYKYKDINDLGEEL